MSNLKPDTESSKPLLLKKLQSNLGLHLILENEVRTTPFGQITFTVELKNGVAQIDTLNVVKNRRRKYKSESSEEA